MRRLHRLALFLAFPALTGAQTTRDSAGIRIVLNDRPILTPAQALRISAAPVRMLGDGGEGHDLSRVMGAVRLANGAIVVADGGSFELRIFDSPGTLLKRAGRRGAGPGEFSRIQALVRLPGDTLAVVDDVGVSLFTSNGTFAKAFNTRNPPIPALGRGGGVASVFPGGARLLIPFMQPAPRSKGEKWIEPITLTLVDAQNAPRRSIENLPFMQAVMEEYARPPWFAAVSTIAADARGFFYGFGSEYSIREYTQDGRLTRIIRRSWTPKRISEAEHEAWMTEWGKRWIKSTGAAAEKERADLRDDPWSPTLPAFSQFIVDDAQRLWVREPRTIDAAWAGQLYGVPLAPSPWSVFDAQGRWLCDVTMPARFLVKEIGRDYVLGVARGADDVESVVMYRLIGDGRAPQ